MLLLQSVFVYLTFWLMTSPISHTVFISINHFYPCPTFERWTVHEWNTYCLAQMLYQGESDRQRDLLQL